MPGLPESLSTFLGGAVLVLYFALLLALTLYGAHRWSMLWLYWRHRGRPVRPAARFDRLPRACASRSLVDGTPIMLKRGVSGYFSLHPDTDVDRFNKEHGITMEQVNAMVAGSMFGWGSPGADPKEGD